jgi:hypothetical protein
MYFHAALATGAIDLHLQLSRIEGDELVGPAEIGAAIPHNGGKYGPFDQDATAFAAGFHPHPIESRLMERLIATGTGRITRRFQVHNAIDGVGKVIQGLH